MKKFLVIVSLIIVIIPASFYLLGRGYFNMHDDLQVMRVYQMDRCFADGQIPCRWSPDMVWGYGQAMFNFYSALPYYIGAFIRLAMPLSILATVKTPFLISLVISAAGMYLLAKEFWGRLGGILSAALYVYAPYHALDIFVRGAMAESFAISILPFLWLSFYKLVKDPNYKYAIFTSISLFFLLITHNISSLIYAPFTILWVLFWLVISKNWKSTKFIIFSGLLGIGLSAFFLLPAIFEQSLIQTQYLTSEYSDYHAHFVTLRQLFIKRDWGFGPSIFGPYDDLSFQIGWPHWWIAILTFFIAIFWIKRKKLVDGLLVLSLLSLFLFTAFLAHPRSIFIWEALPFFKFVQFPWRFLSLVIFFLSFACGALAKPKYFLRKSVVILVIMITIGLNRAFFKPFNFARFIKDEDKFTGVAWDLQQKAAVLDYLPKTAEQAPPARASSEPKIESGQGSISNFTKQSNRFSFDADIFEEAQLVIPVMYFPGWILIVDDKKVENGTFGAHGVISVKIPKGRHIVRGRFTNTPIRAVGNAVTVVSLLILFSGIVLAENKSANKNEKRYE